MHPAPAMSAPIDRLDAACIHMMDLRAAYRSAGGDGARIDLAAMIVEASAWIERGAEEIGLMAEETKLAASQDEYGQRPEDCSECSFSSLEIDPFATGDFGHRVHNCDLDRDCPWGIN